MFETKTTCRDMACTYTSFKWKSSFTTLLLFEIVLVRDDKASNAPTERIANACLRLHAEPTQVCCPAWNRSLFLDYSPCRVSLLISARDNPMPICRLQSSCTSESHIHQAEPLPPNTLPPIGPLPLIHQRAYTKQNPPQPSSPASLCVSPSLP